jgi:hypothetical protein
MTESIPSNLDEEVRQLNRSLTKKVLDRAASDPAWKQQLIDDPEAAMQEANFPEPHRLEEIRQSIGSATLPEEEEVKGQIEFGHRLGSSTHVEGLSSGWGSAYPSPPSTRYRECAYFTQMYICRA